MKKRSFISTIDAHSCPRTMLLLPLFTAASAASVSSHACDRFGVMCKSRMASRSDPVPANYDSYTTNVQYNATISGAPVIVTGQIYQFPNSTTNQLMINFPGGVSVPQTTYTDNNAGLEYTISQGDGGKGVKCVITDNSNGPDTTGITFIGSTFIGNYLADGWEASSGSFVVALFQSSFDQRDVAFVINATSPTPLIYGFNNWAAGANKKYDGVPASIASSCQRAALEDLDAHVQHSILHARAMNTVQKIKQESGRR